MASEEKTNKTQLLTFRSITKRQCISQEIDIIVLWANDIFAFCSKVIDNGATFVKKSGDVTLLCFCVVVVVVCVLCLWSFVVSYDTYT
jgi:hypothetical protein